MNVNKIEKFFANRKLRHYSKGEYIIEAGKNPTSIFYIVSGQVRQFDTSAQGNEIVLNVFKPGAFFPMSYAFNKTPNHYYYQAFSDVELRCADIEETLDFVGSDLEVLVDLLSRVYKGTDGLLKRMVQLMSGSGKSRFIQELLIQARRFGVTGNNKEVYLQMTLTELASRAGITRETASRVTSGLRKQGLVKIIGPNLFVKNLEDLEKLLDERDLDHGK